MVISGLTVMGSLITPLSNFLTRPTSRAWFSIDMFLWMMPMPPSCAMVIASRASVTVSMAADSTGKFDPNFAGQLAWTRMTSRGKTSEYAGTSRTSSKVSASSRIRMSVHLRFVRGGALYLGRAVR